MSKTNFSDVIHREKRAVAQTPQKIKHRTRQLRSGELVWYCLVGLRIRSATINLGFLKTLKSFGILQKADYMSTVSGGGYTHSYVQATVKKTGTFDKLFTDDHIDSMRKHGE